MKPKQAIITVALVVGGIRLWMQIRGKTKTPFSEWAIGYGVLMIFLAFLVESYPPAAGALAGTVVVGDFLKNGSALFDDITQALGQATSGQSLFVAKPFASSGAPASSSTPGDVVNLGDLGPVVLNPAYGVAAPGKMGTAPAPSGLPNPTTGWNLHAG